MTYEQAQQYVRSANVNDIDVIDQIKRAHNCREVEIDLDGDVWIEGPQRGHWLSAEDLVETVAKIQRGI